MTLLTVRLLKPYVRDLEWWVAYPCDPRWSYHDADDVLEVDEEEARELIASGDAVEVPEGSRS